MFVAVAGVGIHFLHLLEEDGFLRAVVDAGKAELTIAFRLYARGCQFVIATRTDLGADTAADTGICDSKGILAMQQETRFRIYARCLQESGMLLPFQFRHRFVPTALCSQVGADAFQAFGDVLVYLDLLVHIEVRQPVVHHNHP